MRILLKLCKNFSAVHVQERKRNSAQRARRLEAGEARPSRHVRRAAPVRGALRARRAVHVAHGAAVRRRRAALRRAESCVRRARGARHQRLRRRRRS